ncbi:hypothetical protein [Crocosphaera sp.]|uniref:hypothetical protein n=1 Tax=Crocosphaera sp. TaxID=2729996 RepID=UPI0026069267|nr:hypothetical protein [Crocosphaera sp.]MDJ0581081.1 hypothetical protein [Crocosphaera sp.]
MSDTSTKPLENKPLDIRIFGPRASGKTTYLTTLAECPDGLKQKYPELQVIKRNDETKELEDLSKNTLAVGSKVPGTTYEKKEFHNLNEYDFVIKIPGNKQRPGIELELLTKDFPGEFFHDIPRGDKQQDPDIKKWIDDLFTTDGWMIMMTDWEPENDLLLYQPAFKELHRKLSGKQKINPKLKELRIAVVMTKCERGELWPCRLDPDEDLFAVRLPKTYEFITQKFTNNPIQFFACSAFGILGDDLKNFDPRPNCRFDYDGPPEEIEATLREPEQWSPYGLIPPLYWLATGIRLEE